MRHMTSVLNLALLLLLAGAVLANGTPSIDWAVVGAGGRHVESAPFTLDGTLGQPVVGTAMDTGSELCSGFWCGVGAAYSIYLPLVLRDA